MCDYSNCFRNRSCRRWSHSKQLRNLAYCIYQCDYRFVGLAVGVSRAINKNGIVSLIGTKKPKGTIPFFASNYWITTNDRIITCILFTTYIVVEDLDISSRLLQVVYILKRL